MKNLMTNIRQEFSALEQKPYGRPLVYLDSAATSLKPRVVVEALQHFYKFETANVHRGAHFLSDRATEKFEHSREKVRRFIVAEDSREIIFTSGTTGSINLVAQTYGRKFLHEGDEIILSLMEHHSNIVPWQMLAEEKKLTIKWLPVTDSGELQLSEFKKLLSSKTKFVSLVHCSNTLGTVNNIGEFISAAHVVGAKILIDAAQSITFTPIDVKKLNCDFLVFSAHKLYGPYGVGVLYGRHELLESMPPYQGGGSMIAEVSTEKTTYLKSPQKFEAGTPNISGVIALATAIEFVEKLGFENIFKHEQELVNYTTEKLKALGSVQLVGESPTRVNLVSFNLQGLHQSDVGQILDQQGVAVRVGHHCTQPLMKRFGITGTIRASFGVYNSREDVDILLNALKKAQELLR